LSVPVQCDDHRIPEFDRTFVVDIRNHASQL
jgi:hypothetical protein